MEITYLEYFQAKPTTMAVEDFVERSLRDTSYEGGHLESFQTEHNNLKAAFARLIGLLATKGMLSATEVADVATNCSLDAKFEPTDR